jgi:hypothetical protein
VYSAAVIVYFYISNSTFLLPEKVFINVSPEKEDVQLHKNMCVENTDKTFQFCTRDELIDEQNTDNSLDRIRSLVG